MELMALPFLPQMFPFAEKYLSNTPILKFGWLTLEYFCHCTNLQLHVISKPRSVSILEVFLNGGRQATFYLDCTGWIYSQRILTKGNILKLLHCNQHE